MASTTGTKVTLNWNTANDSQTVSRTLTYNLRVGTTPGGSQVVAPMADTATGYRRVPQWATPITASLPRSICPLAPITGVCRRLTRPLPARPLPVKAVLPLVHPASQRSPARPMEQVGLRARNTNTDVESGPRRVFVSSGTLGRAIQPYGTVFLAEWNFVSHWPNVAWSNVLACKSA